MPAAGSAVAAFTEYPDLIDKIAFFQVVLFLQRNANIPCHQLKYLAMKFILLILALPLMNKKCGKNKNLIPACVQQRVEAIQKEPRWSPPAEVNEYSYKGKQVYLFTSNCCDQYNSLYDGDCNNICAPSGGLTGKGDGKCDDFLKVATHIKLIWKDPG